MNPVLFPDWKDQVVFSSAGPQPQVLAESERFKVVVAGLEAGQQIPPHPEVFGLYHFLQGSGWMIVDGERMAVGAGATVIVPDGSVRGMEAETQLAFIATRIVGANHGS